MTRVPSFLYFGLTYPENVRNGNYAYETDAFAVHGLREIQICLGCSLTPNIGCCRRRRA